MNTEKKFKMNYSLATNLDLKLLDEIKKMDTDKSIKVVYGKLKTDVIGGGRAAGTLLDKSMQDLKEYIKACHDIGVEFMYLLNPMCMSNMELEKESRQEIMDFIESLVDAGVDWLTLNSPYLCKVVKEKFPKIKISVGIHACVSEIQQIKYWEDLGADEITLQMYVTRNFKLLEEMLLYTKKSGILLRVLGNNCCLHACPYRINHATGQSHASRKKDGSDKFYMDNNLITCTMEKVRNTTNLIASEWIRPEDVKYYEELCEKTNNYNFSIKLVERTKTTEFLVRVAKAYIDRSYDGNLLDIVLWPVASQFAKLKEGSMPESNSSEPVSRFFNFFNLPDVYIDNKKLDGFFEKFTTNYECNKKTCNGIGKCDTADETTCSYCNGWAKRAVVIKDGEKANEWLSKGEKLLDDIYNGCVLP